MKKRGKREGKKKEARWRGREEEEGRKVRGAREDEEEEEEGGRKKEAKKGKEARKGRERLDSELNLTRAKASFCSPSLSCGGRSLRAGRSGEKRSDE